MKVIVKYKDKINPDKTIIEIIKGNKYTVHSRLDAIDYYCNRIYTKIIKK